MTIKRSLVLALLLVQLVFVKTALSQSTAPTSRTPGAPAGSYALSDFESVNLFSGNLNFSLPLLEVTGRGSVSQPLSLTIETQWGVVGSEVVPGGPQLLYVPSPHIQNPFGYIGQMWSDTTVSQLGEEPCGGGGNWTNHRFNFRLIDADGTEHMLVDPIDNGRPFKTCGTQNINYGRVFRTTNNEFMTFVSDADVWSFGAATGYLHYKDGRKSRIVNTRIEWTQDRNGNRMVYEYLPGQTEFEFPLIKKITDSIGRQITIDYGVNEGAPYGVCDKLTFKGYQGTDRIIRISKDNLQNLLRTTQPTDSSTLKTFGQLFPDAGGDDITIDVPPNLAFNYGPLIRAVWLPDGRSYQFQYDVTARLARVVLPTGGAMEYDYEPTGISGWGTLNPFIINRVTEKRIYKDASTLESKTTFSKTLTSQGFPAGSFGTVTDVELFDHLGNRQTKTRHFFKGQVDGEWGYVVPWWNGREIKTEFFAANGTTVLKRIENDWRQRIPSWCFLTQPVNSPCGPNPPDTAPTINPFILETKTTLVDANLVSKTSALKPDNSFGFDNYNNQTHLYEYDFGNGVVGPLKRRTETLYLNSASYVSNDVHLLSLPTRKSVYDAAGTEQARTILEYDVYSGANHAALKDWSTVTGIGMFGHDASFNTSYLTRGNQTAVTHSIFINGQLTGSVSNFTQYDLAGNQVKTIEPNGNVTTNDYLDCFGAPNGEARTNGTSGLTGTNLNAYAFPTVATNALNHKTYTQFDYYLGQPVDLEDANGVVGSTAYNDPIDRPTQIKRAVGTPQANQTTFSYNDTTRTVTATSDRDADNDNLLMTKTIYDGMGRTVETRRYEGGPNYIATQTQYDALGRAFKTSNPFRPWQGESAVWTTQTFDSLGRLVSVTTPDNATVTSSYSGNAMTATDQAGKTRKRVTDGLGRLSAIYEDPSGLNYQTSYTYDVQDNLVRVTQGTQQRFFMYDSLRRLIRVRLPEQSTLAALNLTDALTGNAAWSIGYQYDANNNLTQKTDARGVVSTYAYDLLNRNTSIDYSDTTSTNPDVTRVFDGATFGKGRLWYSYAGGSETVGSTVEKTILESYDALGRPVTLKQLFKSNSLWSAPYQITRSYNLVGGVTSQVYPSTHSVTYNYDAAGRLADKDAQNLAFKGNLGDGTLRTYSRGITYVSSGKLKQEQFGTNTPVYNKLFYNSRQQIAEILASTTGGDTSWNRGKILNQFSLQCSGASCNATDNNGNLRKQEVYIPANDQVSSYTSWYQQFDYDSLNRLLRVHEYTGNVALDSQQEYVYDRWGNRTIHQTNTFGLGINKKNFTVSTANNRLGVPAGQSGTLTFDNAGNLTSDSYTGAGDRTYDADNKITSAQDSLGGWSHYTYNADGQRTRRKISNQETWQIYGFDGELVAEYTANAAVTSPQKEYGYRSGQLLVSAESGASGGGAPQNVTWTNGVGVSISGNNLTRTLAGDAWNAGATSSQSIASGDGYVEFTASETNKKRGVGLTTSTSVTGYQHVNYGIVLGDNGLITIHEGLSVYGTFGSYTTGDVLRVAIEAGVVKYRKNGTLLRTSTLAPSYPLYAGASLFHNSCTVSNAVVPGGGPQNVTWANGVGVSISGNNLTRTLAGDAWNAGATSSQSIASGDGYVEFTASETNKKRGVGLTTSTSVTGYQHVNYGIVLGDNGLITIHEGLSVYGTFGSYTTGDVLRVAIEAGVVKYRKNGTLLRTSTLAPSYPLYAGAALFHNGCTITNAVLSVGGSSSSAKLYWLISDHLGTPRILIDQTGALANIGRHDYLPFGEELSAGVGVRTVALGYSISDGVRQQFTSKERDLETGMDYFEARSYQSVQGRFTSPDPLLLQEEMLADPQRFNLYSYVRNNPLTLIDPTGEAVELTGDEEERKKKLELLRQMVGAEAGAYLYENKAADGKYYVGIYKNGPDGKGKDFGSINAAAGNLVPIINDTLVAEIQIVPPNTYEEIGTIQAVKSPGATGVNEHGRATIFLMDPAQFPGFLPANLTSDGKMLPLQPSDVLAHELGHVAVYWGLAAGSHEGVSVSFENDARKVRDPNTPTRTSYSRPGDLKDHPFRIPFRRWPR